MKNLDLLNECTLCSRNCKVNRNNNSIGFCKASNTVKVARAALHLGKSHQSLWETVLEPCSSHIAI